MARGPKIIDLTGTRFGRLEVLELAFKKKKSTSSKIGGSLLYWRYRCDCGNEGVASGANLKSGQTRSCGCLYRESIGNKTRTHGMSTNRGYLSWAAMHRRCRDSGQESYKNYGQRGINVCERWDDFAKFWEDMGSMWFEGASIERVNVNGDYSPDNCIWVTLAEQANNKRRSVWIDTPWGQMTVADAARTSGIPYEVIRVRFHQGKLGTELFALSQRDPKRKRSKEK